MTMVDRFTSIIDAFDDATVGLSLDQVAARAELPRSTTHRILDHLVRLSWVSHSDRGYGLGDRAMSWGAGDATDLRLRSAAAPVLHHLQIKTGAVVHLGVLAGLDIVHVDKLGGPSAPVVPTRVGTRAPAPRLALGLAVLAVQPPELVGPGIDVIRARACGVVTRRGDYGPEFTSVAATIDHRAALGIVLPANASAQRYEPLLRAAAGQVRRELTDRP
ncbi:DNA-binding transcriptional regulator, IclR family [Mycobacterium rhizamassiliense]|uniref:DNA-binding transcriptional regulator, IclR family n=1 Tax=Mycobacterium rhizamassiliense TaxID=1841860 RepID=A0A2U3NQG3_9MYCO|nr:helix-turn-helix domain-containing protein [Mycobacterium rhizamassiliense]SPM33655.1 DNA-binding transcriptional regulator, IclR family [Mycobacterium rhizamassiliense]